MNGARMPTRVQIGYTRMETDTEFRARLRQDDPSYFSASLLTGDKLDEYAATFHRLQRRIVEVLDGEVRRFDTRRSA